MQVRIHAFELTPPAQLPITEFLSFLHAKSSDEYRGYLIPTTMKDDFYVGLALEPKDMKSFCKFKKAGRKFEIKTEELEKGTNLADFNFFLINPETGRGLYSHYHRSTSLHEFCWLLQHRFSDFKADSRKAQIAGLPEGHKKKDESAIVKKYSGYLRYSPIFRPATFTQRMAAMSSISEFEFTLTTFEPLVGEFTPLTGKVERVTAGFRFSQQASVAQIKGLLAGFVDQKQPKSAKVFGTANNGQEVVYKLYNDFDTFESFDFDHFLSNLSIDSSDLDRTLQKSDIVSALIKLAGNRTVRAMLSARTA